MENLEKLKGGFQARELGHVAQRILKFSNAFVEYFLGKADLNIICRWSGILTWFFTVPGLILFCHIMNYQLTVPIQY